MNARMNEIRPLTNFLTFFPTWSPDGKKLAFDTPYQDPRGANVIWIINADGTGLRDISQHGVGEWRMPHWSPDGRNLVHLRYIGIGTSEIFVMDTSGQSPVRLTQNVSDDRYPKWSADGKMITWTTLPPGGKLLEVWIMNSDGTGQRKLIDGSYPAFSPDSRTTVFSALNPAGNKIVLWRIELDGTNLRQLTH
jgi:TolB protein